MSLRCTEINQVLEELDLPQSLIQQVTQPDYQNLLLQVYQPRGAFWLRISLSQGKARLHRAYRHTGKKVKLQRFAEFLRSRIKGGRITHVAQIGLERVVDIQITRGEQITRLLVRLWGAAGNIIATDENLLILDAFYRRPTRKEVSGELLELPQITNTQPGDYPIRSFEGYEAKHHDMQLNQMIDGYYADLEEDEERKNLLIELKRRINQRESSLSARLKGLKNRERDYEDEELYRIKGELVTNQADRIQRGMDWVELENYYEPGTTLTIQLDPSKSPQENAEGFFQQYRKAKTGKQHVLEEQQSVLRQLEHAEFQRLQIESEETSLDELRVLAEELRATSKQPRKAKQASNPQLTSGPPGLEYPSGGYRILVGRTAKENDELLRRWVKGNDLWLHTRDYPGGYVFIKSIKGKSVPLEVLLDAATLALFYSKAKNNGEADLYYTHVKYLRRPKQGKLGLVLPTQEKNLHINLDEHRLKKIAGLEPSKKGE